MNLKHLKKIFASLLLFAGMVNATPIDVEYEIQTYSSGDFSASWLHTASDCDDNSGPNSGSTLYMCGDMATPVTGTITGTLDNGILTIDGGTLNIFGQAYDVQGGNLGGDFANAENELLWFLQVEYFGSFYFENIAMGAGGPNSLSGSEFILWGQNYDAYGCENDTVAKSSLRSHCEAWAIDLYAKSVPEPGTIALLAVGLFALGLTSRRRQMAAISMLR